MESAVDTHANPIETQKSARTPAMWRWLIEPAAAIQDSEARRRARLLSALLLPITLGTVLGALAAADQLPELATIALLLGATYGLSRTRHSQAARVITLAVMSGFSLYATFSDSDYSADSVTLHLLWIILPLLLAGLTASPHLVTGLSSAIIIAILLLPVLIAEMPFSSIYQSLGFTGVSSALIVLTALLRQQAQSERQSSQQSLANHAWQLERSNYELETLRRINLAITSSLELEDVFDAILAGILDLSPHVRDAHVFLYDEQQLTFGAAIGPDGPMLTPYATPRADGITATVAREGKAIVVEDMTTHPLYKDIAGKSASKGAISSFPLKVGQRVVGVMNAAFSRPRHIPARELSTLRQIANQAAIAIDNAKLYEQAQQLVAIEERQRIARDLHDVVNQNLHAAAMTARALPVLWRRDREQARQKLADVAHLIDAAIAEMRGLLFELQPERMVGAQLGDLLKELGEAAATKTTTNIEVRVEGDRQLPVDVKVAIYRIGQEAIHNIIRHANASVAKITLTYQQAGLKLSISDNGQGFGPARQQAGHFGLGNIQRRAQEIGANLEINSQPAQGTNLTVLWTEPTERD